MRIVVVGSSVFKSEFNDIDIIIDEEAYFEINKAWRIKSCTVKSVGNTYLFEKEGVLIEATIPPRGSAFDFILNQDWKEKKEIFGFEAKVIDLPCLGALMKAHLILPHPKWTKHMENYGLLKQKLSVSHFLPSQFEEQAKKIFKLHRNESLSKARRHPKLNQSKDNFFEEAEFKIFDHDSIHKAVALGENPAYTYMQDGEVWCSKKKWNKLSETEKLNCVLEEASVLALERSIIPSLFLGRPFIGAEKAFNYALMKICTTITSGFFRNYAIEHYQEAISNRPDFTKSFFEGIKSKVVILLKPEVVFNHDA